MSIQYSDPNISVSRPFDSDWHQIMDLLETANFNNIGGREMPEFPLSDCFVARKGDQVVGICGYKILDPETAKCTLTVVAPEYRGNGLATLVKQECVDYLKAQGIKKLFSNNDDESVINWNISKFGFRRTGKTILKVEDYGRGDVDHWVCLVADLTTPAASITRNQVAEYHSRGYLVLKDCFSSEEVQAWSAESHRLWNLPGMAGEESFRVQSRERIGGGRVLERVDWVLPESALFMDLALDDRILIPVQQLFDEKPVLFKDKLIVRPPGTHGYGLHQDYPYWEEAGIPADELLSVCVAIDETDHRNGILSVFPGYHDRRLASPADMPLDTELSEVDLASEESIPMKAGDLLIFHTLVPHRSSPNSSPRSRRMLFLSYAAGRHGANLYERYYQLKANSVKN